MVAVGCHDRGAARHGLDQRPGQALGHRRLQEQLAARHPAKRVGVEAHERDVGGDPELGGERLEGSPVAAQAQDDQARGPLSAQLRERPQHGRIVLLGDQAADRDDHRRPRVGEPGVEPGVIKRRRGERRQIGSDHRVPDGQHPLGRESQDLAQVARDALRDRGHGVGERVDRALERDLEAAAPFEARSPDRVALGQHEVSARSREPVRQGRDHIGAARGAQDRIGVLGAQHAREGPDGEREPPPPELDDADIGGDPIGQRTPAPDQHEGRLVAGAG